MTTTKGIAAAEIGADMLRGVQDRIAEGKSIRFVLWALVDEPQYSLPKALGFETGSHLIQWCDTRTQAEVLARIDQALERAGGGE